MTPECLGYNPQDFEIPKRNLDSITLFCRSFDRMSQYKNSLEFILQAIHKADLYNPINPDIVPNNYELKTEWEGMISFAAFDYIQRVQKKVLRESSFIMRHTEFVYANVHVSTKFCEVDGIKRKYFSVIYSLTSYRNPAYRSYGTVRHTFDLSVPRIMPESGIYLRINSILEQGKMPLFEIRAYHTELFNEQANQFKAQIDKLLLNYDSIGKITV
jgi:hypothetical protein